jgi:hypothetical protein
MHNALKHLFAFAFALVFMTGTAFAQNNQAFVDQQNDDDVRLEQVNVNGPSYADIEQLGGGNWVRGLTGADPFLSESSRLEVIQAGGSVLRGQQTNSSVYDGRDHLIRLNQSDGAVATIDQRGRENEVTGLNRADLGVSEGSTLDVFQRGFNNRLRFEQLNGGNLIELTQDGNNGFSRITQE